MKDTNRALFMRKQAKLVEKIVKSISQDQRLQNILKSTDEHLLTAFLTNLLMAGSGQENRGVENFDAENIDSASFQMLNSMVHLIFDTHNGEDALGIIIEHVESEKVPLCAKSMRKLCSSLTSSLSLYNLNDIRDLSESCDESSGIDLADTGNTKTTLDSSYTKSICSDVGNKSKPSTKWVDTKQLPNQLRIVTDKTTRKESRDTDETSRTESCSIPPLLSEVNMAMDVSHISASGEDELKRLSNECRSLSLKLKELPKFTPEWTLVRIEMKYITEELEHVYAKAQKGRGAIMGSRDEESISSKRLNLSEK